MNRLLNRASFQFRGLLASTLFLAVAVSAAENSHTIRVELYPEGQHSNPVVLSVTGERYTSNQLIPVPPNSGAGAPELQFLGQLIAANANGSLQDVLSLWDSRDREAIRKLASDPAVFEGNRNFYRGITSSHLLARISYGNYDIFFVQHITKTRTIVKDYPVVHVNGALMATNALQNDPVFVYLSTKYAQALQQGLQ
jgi:hypothetical protein